jgi:hypothetical protein
MNKQKEGGVRGVENEEMKRGTRKHQCSVCGEVKDCFRFILRCADTSTCKTDATRICEKRRSFHEGISLKK